MYVLLHSYILEEATYCMNWRSSMGQRSKLSRARNVQGKHLVVVLTVFRYICIVVSVKIYQIASLYKFNIFGLTPSCIYHVLSSFSVY